MSKECNFRAVKAKQQGGWTSAHFETVEEAKSWISPCDHFTIFDITQDKPRLVDYKNWDLKGDRGIWDEPEVHIERVKNV